MNPQPNRSFEIKVNIKFFEDLQVRLWLLFRMSAYLVLAVVCGVALLIFGGGIVSAETSDNLEANWAGIKYILSIVFVVFIVPLAPSLKAIFNSTDRYIFSDSGLEVNGNHKKYSDFAEFLETSKAFIFNNYNISKYEAYIIPKRCFNSDELNVFADIWPSK